MAEETTDPEIHDLLKEANTRDEPTQKAVWDELQRYRKEALAAVKVGEDTIERELRVALARGKLKQRLKELLKA